MKSSLSPKQYKIVNVFSLTTLVLGIFAAISIIIAGYYGKKWTAATGIGVVGVFAGGIFLPRIKELLLFSAAFFIPLRIDFYINFKRTYFIESAYPGIPVTAFDIVFLILLAQYIILLYKKEAEFAIPVSIVFPSILFLLFSGLSTVNAEDFSLSLSTFCLILKSIVILFLFANIIKTNDDILAIILGTICAVLLQCFVGSLQYITNGAFLEGVFGIPDNAFHLKQQGGALLSRVGGTIGHANTLAKFLCFCIPVLFMYGYIKFKSFFGKISLSTTFFAGFILILTMSRGSWAALALSSFYLLYAILRSLSISRIKAIVFVFLVNFTISAIVFGAFEDVRIRLLESDYRSAQDRVPLAETALNVIRYNPVMGIGLNNYTRVMGKYDRTNEWLSYRWPHPVHNSYLLLAAEAGIPALIAFLWIVTSVFNKMRHSLRCKGNPLVLLQIGCAMGIVNWLISALFDRDYAGTSTMLWFVMGFMLALHNMIDIENN
jgi:hypothetical protein